MEVAAGSELLVQNGTGGGVDAPTQLYVYTDIPETKDRERRGRSGP